MAERALPALAKGINAHLPSPVAIEVESVELTRFAMAKAGGDGASVLTTATSPNSPDALVLIADSIAVALLVSVLFGSDPDEPVTPIERLLSPTEVEVVAMAFDEAAKAVNGSGDRAFAFNLPLPRPITGPALAKHVVRDGPAVRMVFSLGGGASRGRLSLLMPQRVLLKHRGDGSPAPAAAVAGEDQWSEKFGEEVMRSSVSIEATMSLARLTLADIACLKVGQIIEFDEKSRKNARLSARHKTLFVCEFGKLGQNYTVRIRQPFDERQDLIDGLMPA
jgi:flagellar motor switch protein FliM